MLVRTCSSINSTIGKAPAKALLASLCFFISFFNRFFSAFFSALVTSAGVSRFGSSEMIASSEVGASGGAAAKPSLLSSALDSESAGASSNVSVDMAGMNSSFVLEKLMTVDLQIRTVQLDSDDQGLVEALGMPRALLDE